MFMPEIADGLKANECKNHQRLKMFRSRIDLFGILNAVMAISNPFVKLHATYLSQSVSEWVLNITTETRGESAVYADEASP